MGWEIMHWDSIMLWLESWIEQLGFLGMFALLFVQILQVVIAIIPGEAVEILAGLLYGTLLGFVICEIGMLIGTIMIYYFVKKVGHNKIEKFEKEEKFAKYKILNNTKSLEMMVFIMFFIPGTPKDLLTYFIPFTKIEPKKFFTIVSIARAPSIISSTYAGSSMGEGDWIQMGLMFLVIIVTGLLGIKYNNQIVEHFSKKKEN